jgi:D-alanyl-D-alanine carboxypeptidase
MKKSLLLALFISLSATLCAQSFSRERMDSLLTRLADHDKAMGSLTLWKGGKPVYERAIGWSRIEGNVRNSASTNSLYRIGSITKSFTAVLIFQQIEKGRLSQDSKLAEFFPQFPNAGKITIGQMLQHRSGLANVTDDTAYLQWNTKPQSKEQLLQRMVKAGTSFEPDAKSAYSNTNYILLGLILEKLTGKSYADLVQTNIAAPLGCGIVSFCLQRLGKGARNRRERSRWCRRAGEHLGRYRPFLRSTVPGQACFCEKPGGDEGTERRLWQGIVFLSFL